MDNSIYEVSRDEYAGFISQIKPESRDIEVEHIEDCTIIKVRSKKTNKHLSSRIICEDGEEGYYIFEMPDNDERCAPKPVTKITLLTKESVQDFFNVLGETQK